MSIGLQPNPHRSVIVGSFALRAGAYSCEPYEAGPEELPPVSGLWVTDEKTGMVASWHESTGLYGFLSLPAGSRRLRIEAPSGGSLPAVVRAEVPDRAPLVAALTSGRPAPDARLPWTSHLVRPTINAPLPGGQTIAWGAVTDPSGAPIPWALVHLSFPMIAARRPPGPNAWATLTDGSGVFLVWLRGLPWIEPVNGVDPAEYTGSLSVRRRASVLTGATAWEGLPENLDALLADGTSATWFDGGSTTVSLSVSFGRRLRVPDVTIP